MEVADVLGADGLLSRTIGGFAHRPQQLGMAEAVGETLEQGGNLIVEAGTGTGKTFAYLVPALLSGQKVIISTGTRNLQDQLFCATCRACARRWPVRCRSPCSRGVPIIFASTVWRPRCWMIAATAARTCAG